MWSVECGDERSKNKNQETKTDPDFAHTEDKSSSLLDMYDVCVCVRCV